jgi:hypothetical protein
VCRSRWHFVVPSAATLADMTTLAGVVEAFDRGERVTGAAIAVPGEVRPWQRRAAARPGSGPRPVRPRRPAPAAQPRRPAGRACPHSLCPHAAAARPQDDDAGAYNAPTSVFESSAHLLHGALHLNGFGHLLRMNAGEGGGGAKLPGALGPPAAGRGAGTRRVARVAAAAASSRPACSLPDARLPPALNAERTAIRLPPSATGKQLLVIWDRICEMLRAREVRGPWGTVGGGAPRAGPCGPCWAASVGSGRGAGARTARRVGQWVVGADRTWRAPAPRRQVSVEDVSSRGGMLLRILHTVAAGSTWYGRLGYGFGRAGFNLSARDWEAAVRAVARAELGVLAADFEGVDAAAVAILGRYQGQGGRSAARRWEARGGRGWAARAEARWAACMRCPSALRPRRASTAAHAAATRLQPQAPRTN